MASQALASRSRMQTFEPSSRKRAAVAAPIPLAPPVIRTRLSFRPRIAVTGSLRLHSRITGDSGRTESRITSFVLYAGAVVAQANSRFLDSAVAIAPAALGMTKVV